MLLNHTKNVQLAWMLPNITIAMYHLTVLTNYDETKIRAQNDNVYAECKAEDINPFCTRIS